MRRFLAGAAGLTVIVDRLLEFRPDGVPAETIWPAYEPDLFTDEPPDPELRRRLGIADGESVLVYAGQRAPVERGRDAEPLPGRRRREPPRPAG